jgi:hypothetical protein
MPGTGLKPQRALRNRKQEAAMKPIDKAKTSARRSVTDRMRMFIVALMGQFTTTPEELLQRAESELLIRRGHDRSRLRA